MRSLPHSTPLHDAGVVAPNAALTVSCVHACLLVPCSFVAGGYVTRGAAGNELLPDVPDAATDGAATAGGNSSSGGPPTKKAKTSSGQKKSSSVSAGVGQSSAGKRTKDGKKERQHGQGRDDSPQCSAEEVFQPLSAAQVQETFPGLDRKLKSKLPSEVIEVMNRTSWSFAALTHRTWALYKLQ